MVQERASSGVRVEHWPPKSHRTSSRARAGSSRRRPSKFIPALDEFLAQPFVAADFETANRSSGVSACQIALVRVESGRVVDRFNTLLKPPSGFDDFEFTYLHGISAHDTRTAPSWPDIVPAIRGFAGDATVYAHNAPFDSRVWRQLDEFFHTRSLPDHFFCSYLTARRMMPGLDNYRLPTVLERCAPQFVLDHHKADSDAEACALIVAALQSNPELYARLEAHR
ncbi:DNA polymerase III subunit epsilon [Propionibacterium freudenreichii]|nr:DNA polymerase III subunit epsilon [Propionibacterium freudenreichii]MDK9347268.1 DNA polymerase III subunit epsilon [Propionibacterium freudenreichii]